MSASALFFVAGGGKKLSTSAGLVEKGFSGKICVRSPKRKKEISF
jgi:hypothetical protein